LFPEGTSNGDVASLRRLVASAQQQNYLLSLPGEVDAKSWTKIQLQLADAYFYTPRIANEPAFKTKNSGIDPAACHLISYGGAPPSIFRCLPDDDP